MRIRFSLLLASALGNICIAQVAPVKTAPAIDFQREIRPILSDACFQCHGPDKATRMAGLRLDTKEGAFTERKNGTAIVPGKPAASLIMQRLTHAEKGKRMPPEYSHKSVNPKQIETLQRWITAGANWQEHWAFAAPVRPKLPAIINKAWARNPIDQFILARLQSSALTPALPADRRTLIRRLSLDLTGLPPDPKEVEAFASDTTAGSYEKLVDRLLGSDGWGEHRARYWLDAARYADTHGLHIDNYREMWPYRDWVINAFNRNMPFDRFTLEQVAGDLLPNPDMDQLIATGFHRCNVTTNEGGAIPEEVAAIYAKDRVDTTGTVFLGLTVGCATCHDHKFDPILQKDFYSLAAFFRNTLQTPLDGNIADTPPVMVVPRKEDRARWQQIAEEQAELNQRKEKTRIQSGTEFAKWLGEDDRPTIDGPADPADEILSVAVRESAGITFRNRLLDLALPEDVTLGEGHLPDRKALHFASEGSIELPNVELFEANRPFTISTWLKVPENKDASSVVVSQTDPVSRFRGWALELNRGVPTLRITLHPAKTISFRGRIEDRLAPGTWNHIAVAYDGSRSTAGLALFVNGQSALTEGRGDDKDIKGDFRSFAPLRIGSDGRRKSFAGGAIADLRLFARVLTFEEAQIAASWPLLDSARDKPASELTEAERESFQLFFLNREYADYGDLLRQMETLQNEKETIARRGVVTHVQHERDDQKPFAHILNRGMYDDPKQKVEPAVPSALPPMPASFPRNRLGLARWLIDETNPLTARVTVNRFWQEVFGTGLVKTAEDFGSQGETPSHRELLDWLAVEFRESGWDVKALFKLMVMSSTYRQSAAMTPEKLQKDPENRLLSRGPRFRMDAEAVRDYALAVSGLLAPDIGGPSVKPYQPGGVWEAVAMPNSNTRFYRRDVNDNIYRRSLYTFWKRSAPPASMDIFNAPSRESCTVRRERTNTPLQALVTLNDTQFVEAARRLAQTAMLEGGKSFDGRLDFITLRAIARRMDLKERAIVTKAYQDFLNHYDSHPDDARKLVTTGASDTNPNINAAELAAMTMAASQVLNLDEVLNK
ncbi:MAG: DUF1553 domain-containing protein [Bryobacteraceae bacterium]|nr:DUF1553 domain-containing protein [Bryobacteraceae bacterium]